MGCMWQLASCPKQNDKLFGLCWWLFFSTVHPRRWGRRSGEATAGNSWPSWEVATSQRYQVGPRGTVGLPFQNHLLGEQTWAPDADKSMSLSTMCLRAITGKGTDLHPLLVGTYSQHLFSGHCYYLCHGMSNYYHLSASPMSQDCCEEKRKWGTVHINNFVVFWGFKIVLVSGIKWSNFSTVFFSSFHCIGLHVVAKILWK